MPKILCIGIKRQGMTTMAYITRQGRVVIKSVLSKELKKVVHHE